VLLLPLLFILVEMTVPPPLGCRRCDAPGCNLVLVPPSTGPSAEQVGLARPSQGPKTRGGGGGGG
jgi:hypothetical protein